MSEEEYYENPAIWTSDRFLKNENELRRFEVVHSLIPEKVHTVLDVGCGSGAFMRYLEDRSTNMRLTGYERSSEAIKNKMCQSEIVKGRAEHLIYPDDSFDLVVALEVIEHLPYLVYEKVLRELERVAKEYIIISVPYKETNRLIKCNYCGCTFSPYYHLREFDKEKVGTLFENYTLHKVELINKYKEYFIWNYLKNIWNNKKKNNIIKPHPHSICPHCGYFIDNCQADSSIAQLKSKHIKVKTLLRNITPYRYSYTWIVVVFNKNV